MAFALAGGIHSRQKKRDQVLTIVVVLAAFCGAFFLTVVITFFPSLFGLTNWTFYGQLTVTAPRAAL